MLTKQWGTELLRRCCLKSRLAAATMLAGVLLLPASARAQDCLVQVDKQVSCNNGATWVDQGLVTNDDGAFSCNGVNDVTAIQVRYRVRNAGQSPLFECTLDDSNNLFDLDLDGVILPGLAPGESTPFLSAPGQPLCSDNLEANEPNTANVNCFCTADLDPDLKTSASDSADINCGGPFTVDKQCVDANNDGIDEITITVTSPDLGFTSCTVTDSIFLDDPTCPADVGAGTPVTVAPASFALAAGTSQVVSGSVGPLISDACNTASVSCVQEGTGGTRTATILIFGQQGGGNLFFGDETAGTTTLDATNVLVSITTLNEVATSVDAFFNLDAVSAGPTQNVPGTNSFVQPYNGSFSITSGLGGSGFNFLSGTFLGLALAVEGGTSMILGSTTTPPQSITFTSDVPGMPLDPPRAMALALTNVTPNVTIVNNSFGDFAANVAGTYSAAVLIPPVTVTDTDDAVCPVPGEGCLTRTPGFWGNHPAITAQFLEVEICGVTLDTIVAESTTSATEAICSVGRDGQILGPQLTQLVRQCTAAALNIAASREGGGNCSTDFPNLTEQFAACCGPDPSICTGDEVEDFTITGCIETLDAFNNSIDTLDPFGPFISPGPADSSICRDARNNGVVVTPASVP
jgi:hypothetical protein